MDEASAVRMHLWKRVGWGPIVVRARLESVQRNDLFRAWRQHYGECGRASAVSTRLGQVSRGVPWVMEGEQSGPMTTIVTCAWALNRRPPRCEERKELGFEAKLL